MQQVNDDDHAIVDSKVFEVIILKIIKYMHIK